VLAVTPQNFEAKGNKTDMKTTIAILIGILTVTTARAATDSSAFRSDELNISVFGGWVDKDDSKVAPGVGATYYLSRHWGVGAFTHWENYDGKFIDNFSAEGVFRMPLGELPLAPYGLAGVGYSFETEEAFGMFGGGAEWRLSETFGVFGDLRWQINEDTDDGIAFRAGVRFVF
jgi:hypothetical protein